jgi:hypothetical protein
MLHLVLSCSSCDRTLRGQPSQEAELRDAASRLGWTSAGRHSDLCPACSDVICGKRKPAVPVMGATS